LVYLPFANPERAAREEFGDILLSGLLWLVHTHVVKDAADKLCPMTEADYWRAATNPCFWKRILELRAALLADITSHLTEKYFRDPSPLQSLLVARRRLDELQPADFLVFTNRWLSSLAVWRDRLPVLPAADFVNKTRAIEKALVKLGLADVVGAYDSSPRRARRKRRLILATR
jgi:hypothetical protein